MTKKVLVNVEDEEANNNGLLILFFIVVAIFIGSLSFIAGIIYTSYLDGKKDEECETVKPIEEIIDEKTIEDYLVSDANIVKELDKIVNLISFDDEKNSVKYVYNYLEDEKNYYVLLAYGFVEKVSDKTVVYTDVSRKNVYKEYSKNESFTLDDSNYNDFSKYKVTISKDGNDLYFKSLERIE